MKWSTWRERGTEKKSETTIEGKEIYIRGISILRSRPRQNFYNISSPFGISIYDTSALENRQQWENLCALEIWKRLWASSRPVLLKKIAPLSKRVFLRNRSHKKEFHLHLIFMQIKPISIWKVLHGDSVLNRGKRQLGNDIFIIIIQDTYMI